jgi:tripartite-type tricarboxylate transporter receptor subunit TctC
MLNKRAVLKAIGALPAAVLCARPVATYAQAVPYPSKPITWVVPFGPGNGGDVIARVVAQQLGTLLGQQVIMDNRPGAGGIAATRQVSLAAPDGYTLITLGAGTAISQSLFKPAPFDILKSFEPVAMLAFSDVLLLVRKDSKLRNAQDFIGEAREKKRAMMIGISTLGSAQHLSAELFKLNAKVGYTIVPFKTASALQMAIMAGDVDAGFELFSPMVGPLEGGQIRALAIASPKRFDMLPDVPTGAEIGVPAFDVNSWALMAVPARTPDAIVQRLNREVQRVLAMPEVERRFKEVGLRSRSGSAAQAREFMTSEIAKWGQVISETGVSIK